MPAHEEQGWKTLHSHWQIWVKELSHQVCGDLWKADLKNREEKCTEFYGYTDKVMTATYSTKLNFSHQCEGSAECLESSEIKGCCKNMGWQDYQKTSDHVDIQKTEYVTFPGIEQHSEEGTDNNYNNKVSYLSAQCVDKNVIFLGGSQDSDELHCHQFLKISHLQMTLKAQTLTQILLMI